MADDIIAAILRPQNERPSENPILWFSDGLYLHRLLGLILAQRAVIDHHEFGGQFFRGVAFVAHHNQARLAVYGNGINSLYGFDVRCLVLRFLRLLFWEGCILGAGSAAWESAPSGLCSGLLPKTPPIPFSDGLTLFLPWVKSVTMTAFLFFDFTWKLCFQP